MQPRMQPLLLIRENPNDVGAWAGQSERLSGWVTGLTRQAHAWVSLI